MDVRDDERLAQHLDHRDRRADARLEAQLHARVRGGGEELGAPPGDELLVRGHDVLAAAQQLEHIVAGRLDAAHHLGDDRDRRVVEDLAKFVVSTPAAGVKSRSFSTSRTSALTTPQPVAGRALDVVGVLVQQKVDRRADGAVAEQRDGNVNRRHAPPREPSAPPSARSRAPTCSISVLASLARVARRSSAGRGPSPRSSSRANGPSWIASSTAFMFSLTCSSTTRGPRRASRTRPCRRSSSACARSRPRRSGRRSASARGRTRSRRSPAGSPPRRASRSRP